MSASTSWWQSGGGAAVGGLVQSLFPPTQPTAAPTPRPSSGLLLIGLGGLALLAVLYMRKG